MRYKIALVLLLVSGLASADQAVMTIIPLQYRPASELLPLLTPLLEFNEQLLDSGSGLIIKATPERVANIQALVQQLDQPVKDLLITVLHNSSKSAEQLNSELANSQTTSSGISMHGMNVDTRTLKNSQNQQSLRVAEGGSAFISTGKLKQIQNVNLVAGLANNLPGNNNPNSGASNTASASTAANSGTSTIASVLSTSASGISNVSSTPSTTITSAAISPTSSATGTTGNANSNNLLASISTQMLKSETGFMITPKLNGQTVTIDIQPWSEQFVQGNNLTTQHLHSTVHGKLGEWLEIADQSVTPSQNQLGLESYQIILTKNSLRVLIKVDMVKNQ